MIKPHTCRRRPAGGGAADLVNGKTNDRRLTKPAAAFKRHRHRPGFFRYVDHPIAAAAIMWAIVNCGGEVRL